MKTIPNKAWPAIRTAGGARPHRRRDSGEVSRSCSRLAELLDSSSLSVRRRGSPGLSGSAWPCRRELWMSSINATTGLSEGTVDSAHVVPPRQGAAVALCLRWCCAELREAHVLRLCCAARQERCALITALRTCACVCAVL